MSDVHRFVVIGNNEGREFFWFKEGQETCISEGCDMFMRESHFEEEFFVEQGKRFRGVKESVFAGIEVFSKEFMMFYCFMYFLQGVRVIEVRGFRGVVWGYILGFVEY